MKRTIAIVLAALLYLPTAGNAAGDVPGKSEYLADCVRCHGVDGKGNVPAMAAVPGYRHVDLTQLSKDNDGQFPRQRIFDAIEGSKRFLPHFIGDIPVWGLKYRHIIQKPGPQGDEQVRQRITALVDYIESIQER